MIGAGDMYLLIVYENKNAIDTYGEGNDGVIYGEKPAALQELRPVSTYQAKITKYKTDGDQICVDVLGQII